MVGWWVVGGVEVEGWFCLLKGKMGTNNKFGRREEPKQKAARDACLYNMYVYVNVIYMLMPNLFH